MIDSDGRSLRLILLGSFLLAGLRVTEPILFGHLIDIFGQLADKQQSGLAEIWRIIALLAIVNLIGLVVGYMIALKTDRLVQFSRWDVTRQYLRHVMSLSQAFHQRQPAGALARYMMEANHYLYNMWLQIFREHASSIMTIAILFPVMTFLNPPLSLLLIFLVLLFLIVNIYFAVVTDAGQRAAYDVDRKIATHFYDTVNNASLLQSYDKVGASIHIFQRRVGEFLDIQFPVLTKWATAYVLNRAFSALALLAIFVLGAYLFYWGQTSIGELVTFTSFAGLVISRIEQLTSFATQLLVHRQILVNFFHILDSQDVMAERDDAIELSHAKGDIRFQNVNFAHSGTKPLVKDISFEVKAGQTIALVGETGGGKSTLVGLLCRLWDPQSGAIFIDNINVKDMTLASLRRSISVVFQDSPILQQSLAENLRLGKHDATLDELEELLQLADLTHFLSEEREGWDEVLAHSGRTISGGERQRLGLLRSLLKDAPILILDEATSALDAITETKIQNLIETRRKNRTTIIIAHRLITVRGADVIFVIDKGRIIERGSFDALIAAKGKFAKMVAAQKL
ncbi:MAG: ATP-binding cassette domain-containing protein [Sphingomonadales bacterium]|nr:ATP-binding cassette domain-containing protein [Sphingomonadales bacterium]